MSRWQIVRKVAPPPSRYCHPVLPTTWKSMSMCGEITVRVTLERKDRSCWYIIEKERERESERESGAGTLNLKGYSRGMPLPLAIPVAPHYVAASKQFSIKSTITINKSFIVSRTSSSSSGCPTLTSSLSHSYQASHMLVRFPFRPPSWPVGLVAS